MEENYSLNQQPQNQKQDRFSRIAFLEVGIFELFFVTVVLALLFGTLNYFNILPVSEVFPRELGFLPRQTKPAALTPPPQQNLAPQPSATPSSTATPDITFAKDILKSFLPQVFNPSYIPIESNITFKLYPNTIDNFNAFWDKTNVIFITSQDQRSLDSINIYITKESDSAPSASIASDLTSEIFSLTPQGEWKCAIPENQGTYCENFWQETSSAKIGIGLQQPSVKEEDTNKKVIFMCQYYKDSVHYDEKSCSGEFAESGVQ